MQTRIQELEKGLYERSNSLEQQVRQEGVRPRVSRIAQKHQLEMTVWRPKAVGEGSLEGFKKTPIQVQVEGGYHQVVKFFSRILHLPEILGIAHFTMVVPDDQTQNFHLRTDFTLTSLDVPSGRECVQINPLITKTGRSTS